MVFYYHTSVIDINRNIDRPERSQMTVSLSRLGNHSSKSKRILGKPTKTNITLPTTSQSFRHFSTTSSIMTLSSGVTRCAEITARINDLYDHMFQSQNENVNNAVKSALQTATAELVALVCSPSQLKICLPSYVFVYLDRQPS